MTKLLYFTDVHYSEKAPEGRTEDYGERVVKKMLEVIDRTTGINVVLFGGDLFHRKSEVTMSELGTMMELFSKFKEYSVSVFGILGNHDTSGYQTSSISRRATGVIEAAGFIHWIGYHECINMVDAGIRIYGSPYHADYEKPESYGSDMSKQDGLVNIWLSHGILTDEKNLPYKHSNIHDVAESSKADLILNGHLHTKQMEVVGKATVICPGSIGRVSRDDMHEPSIVFIVVDNGKFKHKIIKLKSAKDHSEVFMKDETKSGMDSDDIKEFAETLARDDDMSRDDVVSVVEKVCEKRPDDVKHDVYNRLGI